MLFRFARRTNVADLELDKEAVIEGRVLARELIRPPGSTATCVVFDALIERLEVGARGRGRKMWVPKSAEVRSAGFFVDDGSAKVWIAADGCDISFTGGTTEVVEVGKKGNQRNIIKMVREGDRVRVRGVAANPRAAEPGDTLVLRPGKNGVLRLLVR